MKAGEILQRLPGQNPWWSDADWASKDPQLAAAAAAKFPRPYMPAVLDDATAPNLYTIRGPRRVGKTTLLKRFVQRGIASGLDPRQFCYFGVDLFTRHDLLTLVEKMHAMFPDLRERPVYFLLDEISRVREWWVAIKWLRDGDPRARSDCFVLTGSSARDLREGIPHLSGREGERTGLDRTLLPMSFTEYATTLGLDFEGAGTLRIADFFTPLGEEALQPLQMSSAELVSSFDRYLVTGGFPRALADHLKTGSVSPKYLQDLWKVVLGDLARLKLSQTQIAVELTRTVIEGLSSPTNFQTLATNANTSGATAKSYVEALNDSYLLLTIYRRDSHGGAQLKSGPKIYVSDPLLAQLPRAVIGEHIVLPDPTKLAEAAAAVALFRSEERDLQTSFGLGSAVYYYVTQRGNEIDFVIPVDEKIENGYPVEVKYVDQVTGEDTRPLSNTFHRGILLTRGVLDLSDAVRQIPTASFAYLLNQH